MNDFSIIEQLSEKQIAQLTELFKEMWWSRNRTAEEISIMLKNSISFGLIDNMTKDLVGYARVLTDEMKYAYIFDVMTLESHRGKGLGKLLINAIINHPRFKKVKNFELTCAPDMVSYYAQFGFNENYGDDVKPMRLSR